MYLNQSRQSFSPQSFRSIDSYCSQESLNSVNIENDNTTIQPIKNEDEIDRFYSQLSMQFYDHQKNYEKKAPRSVTINNPPQMVSLVNERRQIFKGKTESLRLHQKIKNFQVDEGSQTLLNKVTQIQIPPINKIIESKIKKKQVNSQLQKIAYTQCYYNEALESSAQNLSQQQASIMSMKHVYQNQNKLIKLLYAPHQDWNAKMQQKDAQTNIKKNLKVILTK